MRLIDADVLLEKVREIRKLALDRAVETPANMPFPLYQNPAYTRYSTQAGEREKFIVMIEEAPTVQPEQQWIPVTQESVIQAGYKGREVRFWIRGRLFAIRELAQ